MLLAVKLTSNADPDEYGKRGGYGIGFDACSRFSLSNSEWIKNVIFGVDNSLSAHTDNSKIDILVLGEDKIDDLDNRG